MKIVFFIPSFPVSISHETFVKESRWFWGGAIVESDNGRGWNGRFRLKGLGLDLAVKMC